MRFKSLIQNKISNLIYYRIDQAKVAISSSGEITLQESLDFETKEQLEFIVEVFDGQNTVQTPVTIQLDNINDLTANVN